MDRLVCVGLSYKTAPVELRGGIDVLGPVADSSACSEYAILRTCYRVELYARLAHAEAREELVDLFSGEDAVKRDALREHLYVHVAEDAARHLCRVAAGLDSIVLGETEVLGQVRAALEGSIAAHSAGPALNLLFRTAISTGRRARSETVIGANPATASSMALSLAEQVVGDIRDLHVLVIGTGDIGLQAIQNLTSRGIERVSVASHDRARAVEVSTAFGAVAHGTDELDAALSRADIVIAATRTDVPVVSTNAVRRTMSGRTRPLVIVDLAVPANVEGAVGAVPGVHLFDVDDLRAGLDAAMESRSREIPKVEAIVEDEVARFSRRYRELEVAPVVSALRRQAESLRQRELDRVLGELGEIDPTVANRMELLTRTLVTKLLHDPTTRIRERAWNGNEEAVLELVEELFGLSVSSDT
jgi:glutamyl-tRNA reductase